MEGSDGVSLYHYFLLQSDFVDFLIACPVCLGFIRFISPADKRFWVQKQSRIPDISGRISGHFQIVAVSLTIFYIIPA